jgi:hypothetical protein
LNDQIASNRRDREARVDSEDHFRLKRRLRRIASKMTVMSNNPAVRPCFEKAFRTRELGRIATRAL